MMQDIIFEKSEADNWFLRNKDVIISRSKEMDFCTNLIKTLPNLDNIESVIELGSSNGYRLNFLKTILPSCKRFVGIDLSKMAIEDGKSRYGLEMYQSSLTDFKTDEKFDLVIVNFVLHWIDRKNIFQCIANIDKILSDEKEESFLCIGDFAPDFPYKRRYHHTPEEEVYTYKIDYKKVFSSLNTYKTIVEQTYNCDDYSEIGTNTNRCAVTVLKKNLNEFYPEF